MGSGTNADTPVRREAGREGLAVFFGIAGGGDGGESGCFVQRAELEVGGELEGGERHCCRWMGERRGERGGIIASAGDLGVRRTSARSVRDGGLVIELPRHVRAMRLNGRVRHGGWSRAS